MREDRRTSFTYQVGKIRNAAHQGSDQKHSHTLFSCSRHPLPNLAVMAGEAGGIDASPARLAVGVLHGSLHMAHTFRERSGRLVGEAVIVLDDVDACQSERASDGGKLC